MRIDYTHVRLALGAALVVAVLGLTLVATPTASASALEDGTTAVTVSPAQADLKCGETATIDFRINDVQNLFGIDVKLSYEPDIVKVVDSDTTALGLQVQPGDLPDVSGGQGLVQVNAVDSDAGTINYAAIRLNPAPAQSGSGVMFSVKFKGLATGTSPIKFVTVLLSDPEARQIQANQVNGQINVQCDAEPTATTAPGEPTATPVPGDVCTHVVQVGDTLYAIANYYGVTVESIMAANGLTDPHHIYVGQELTIPGCTPPDGPPPPADGDCTHVVQPGETLYGIARRYGVSVNDIMATNGLIDPNYIVVGQILVIPGCIPGPVPGPIPPFEPPAGCFQYTVQPGDLLSAIAYRFCDTVYGIAQRNGLVNPDLIYVGQVLTICGCDDGGAVTPQPSPCQAMHTVLPYETLCGIAMQYGSTVNAIAAANNLANPNLIYVGQQLCIP